MLNQPMLHNLRRINSGRIWDLGSIVADCAEYVELLGRFSRQCGNSFPPDPSIDWGYLIKESLPLAMAHGQPDTIHGLARFAHEMSEQSGKR